MADAVDELVRSGDYRSVFRGVGRHRPAGTGETRFTGPVELVEPPVKWDQLKHAPSTKSYQQHCAWNAPCGREASWSVHVTSKGGDSWWAVCEEHRASSTVLNVLVVARP